MFASSLHRRKREEAAAHRVIADQLNSELRATLTFILRSCELAMSVPDVSGSAAGKLRTIDNLARETRLRLEVNEIRSRWRLSTQDFASASCKIPAHSASDSH